MAKRLRNGGSEEWGRVRSVHYRSVCARVLIISRDYNRHKTSSTSQTPPPPTLPSASRYPPPQQTLSDMEQVIDPHNN